eukprot:s4141_g2.t1
MPEMCRDHFEQQRKKFKLMGNLGPCSHVAEPAQDMTLSVKCNSFADAGLKLMSKTDERLWEQQLSLERKAAYKKWTSLVLSNPGCWSVARPRHGELLFDLLRNGIGESIKDCLGVKATGTLHNRANPLIRFAHYARENFHEPFPIAEHVAYQFLKSGDFAPTFPRSFLTSISFAKHVVGLMHTDDVLNLCRLKGFADLRFTKKRKLVQRPPLKVEQIACLEELVNDGRRTKYDRVAAGFFLFMIFGRLRYSDAQSVAELELEIPMGMQHGYLEGAAERCKTNTTLEKRTRMLPIVVTTKSFTEHGWVGQWLEMRAATGLQAGRGLPLLPNPASGGGWGKTPMNCESAGEWLRAFLKDSSTATNGKDKSLLTYSRDTMSWPVRLLEAMIEATQAGTFVPDATRSGYFPKGGAPEDNSKDDASSSSSCDSRDEEEAEHTRWLWRSSLARGDLRCLSAM